MSGPRKTTCLLILALAISAYGQQPDYHVTHDSSHAIYARSAFLHGHRHGYEEGFHAADQDLHLGRAPQVSNKRFWSPKPVGYRSDFGDKESFRCGFQAGFTAGYSVSYFGREFNHPPNLIVQNPEGAVAKKTEDAAEKTLTAIFDSGVLEGYRAATADAAHFEFRPGLAQNAQYFCRHNLVRGTSEQFCQGYGSGYVLGKADVASKIELKADTVVRVATNQP